MRQAQQERQRVEKAVTQRQRTGSGPVMTCTVRIDQSLYDLMKTYAELTGTKVSSLTRELLEEGMAMRLDPTEIARRMDAVRDRMIAMAASINSSRRDRELQQQ